MTLLAKFLAPFRRRSDARRPVSSGRRVRPGVLELEARLVPTATVGNFSYGLWEYQDASARWAQLAAAPALNYAVDAQGDVVGAFSYGLWEYRNSTAAWTLLDARVPTMFAVNDVG